MTEQQKNEAESASNDRNPKRRIAASAYLLFRKGRRYLPPVVRGILGFVLLIMGFLGFLPILGFWMIPLGLALMATDIPPLARWLKKRLQRARKKHRA